MDMIDSDDSDEDEETTREIETKIADLKAQVLSGVGRVISVIGTIF